MTKYELKFCSMGGSSYYTLPDGYAGIICADFVSEQIGKSPQSIVISVRKKNPKKAGFIKVERPKNDYGKYQCIVKNKSLLIYSTTAMLIDKKIPENADNKRIFWIKIEAKQ